MARDAAVSSYSNSVSGLVKFLQKLIVQHTPTRSSGEFCQIIEVKPCVSITLSNDSRRIISGGLPGFIARAAVLGANRHSDLILVARTVTGDEVKKSSQGLIMWQVKNDDKYTANIVGGTLTQWIRASSKKKSNSRHQSYALCLL
ncbi:hypothetical protein D9757_005316 [Collybiopsis confluens]|uniref:Uncharacterized protein n=1 Tax=Collybiopsis confluens TaxID=2823264 RepID=A0A8H5HVY6_9AGAR|nr:hypothetical protein D9757_005316 [Collybiopsis confluens]